MIDWGQGEYEITADELRPAAEHVVGLADLQPGERVLDIGTGTGNAALAAAASGATVTGVDPAERLLEVARRQAAAAGLEATFVAGAAEALPFETDSFDVVLSVFGLIFSGDAERAAAETVRVLRPGGRALLTAWVPEGAAHEYFGVFRRAMAQHAPAAGPPPFEWGVPEKVQGLFERHGATVEVETAGLAFAAPSADAWAEQGERTHPMALALSPVLVEAGVYDDVRARALDVLAAGNEDPGAFRITSRYLVYTARLRHAS